MFETSRSRRPLLLCVLAGLSASMVLPAAPVTFPVGPPTLDEAPIDASGAVGPDHLVSLTNHEFVVQDRRGKVLRRSSPEAFWECCFSHRLRSNAFDPRIVWNPHLERFVAVALTGGALNSDPQAGLLIGVSLTSDATGAWQCHRYDVPAKEWLDFANLGFSKRWVAVQVTPRSRVDSWEEDDMILGSRVFVFDGATLDSPTALVPEVIDRPAAPGAWISYEVPALTYDDQKEIYFVKVLAGNDQGQGRLELSWISGEGSKPEMLWWDDVESAEPWTSSPPSTQLLPQKGSPDFLQTDGDYIQSVVQRAGFLWVAHSIYLPVGIGARSSVQWWQIDISSNAPTVEQMGRIDDPVSGDASRGRFFAYPSIAVNKHGDVLLGFGIYATDLYPSAGYAFRLVTDPPGWMSGSKRVLTGEGSYPGTKRWSDYTSTVVDPLDDVSLWTLQVVAADPDPSTDGKRVQLFWVQAAMP